MRDIEDRARTRQAARVTLGCVILLCAVFVATMAIIRMRYPYDLYIWSESPFLTNMLKISAGVGVFQASSLANSFIYPPGMEFLHYALLRPFGLELSIVANRFISFFHSVAACALLTFAVREFFAGAVSRLEIVIVFAILFIAAQTNLTSDLVHPDNLHLLGVAATFTLTVAAIRRQQFGLALVAIVVGGLVLYVKQTAACLSVCAALCVVCLGGFPRPHKIALLLTSVVVTAFAVFSILGSEHASFYLHDVPSNHAILWDRLYDLHDEIFANVGWVLAAGAAVASFCLAFPAHRPWMLTWLAFLVLGCAPALLSFIKLLATTNSVLSLHVFLLVGALPLLVTAAMRGQNMIAVASFVLLPLLILPFKLLPSEDMYRYGREFRQAVAKAVAAKESILVAHGVAMLVRAGRRDVPLDRSVSVLELRAAGMTAHDTIKRIAAGHYDRIFLNSADWYGPEVDAAIDAHYVEVGRVPGVVHVANLRRGNQGLLFHVRILTRRAPVPR